MIKYSILIYFKYHSLLLTSYLRGNWINYLKKLNILVYKCLMILCDVNKTFKRHYLKSWYFSTHAKLNKGISKLMDRAMWIWFTWSNFRHLESWTIENGVQCLVKISTLTNRRSVKISYQSYSVLIHINLKRIWNFHDMFVLVRSTGRGNNIIEIDYLRLQFWQLVL